jgi:hypothetical protein
LRPGSITHVHSDMANHVCMMWEPDILVLPVDMLASQVTDAIHFVDDEGALDIDLDRRSAGRSSRGAGRRVVFYDRGRVSSVIVRHRGVKDRHGEDQSMKAGIQAERGGLRAASCDFPGSLVRVLVEVIGDRSACRALDIHVLSRVPVGRDLKRATSDALGVELM